MPTTKDDYSSSGNIACNYNSCQVGGEEWWHKLLFQQQKTYKRWWNHNIVNNNNNDDDLIDNKSKGTYNSSDSSTINDSVLETCPVIHMNDNKNHSTITTDPYFSDNYDDKNSVLLEKENSEIKDEVKKIEKLSTVYLMIT
mmetsp:Transcript_43114/g.48936  ORF Transcript_43114/g.48936 Transcript_43114/m.48936 type:complete len:141 (-) Transcript_43114:90-512(-)